MNELILYTNKCPTCRWREHVNAAKRFARENDMVFVTRRTDYDAEYREIANDLSMEQPFLHVPNTGKSIRLTEPSQYAWLL